VELEPVWLSLELAAVTMAVLLLIATPIARVVFALIGFARQRDWMYVGVSAIVLALLAYSLAGG
jgi:uncharacterized membrane protein